MANMTNQPTILVTLERTKAVCFVLNFLYPITNHVTFVTTAINAILSPVAVVGNALVLVVIWKNTSLRTPSFILLGGLAFSDFWTGLITQPFYVLFRVAAWMDNMKLFCTGRLISQNAGLYFSSVTLTNISFMAFERWMHMTRRSLLTKRRVMVVYGVLLLFPLLFVLGLSFDTRMTWIAALCLCVFCITATSVAYLKVFQIINHHQRRIQVNYLTQNSNPPSINLAKYKKSVFTILYILVLFLLCHLPFVCCAAVIYLSIDVREKSVTTLDVCTTVLFASSSINPLLYYWRINYLREGIKRLVRKLF